MCVTFEEAEEMAAIAKVFDLLFAGKEKREQNAGVTGWQRARRLHQRDFTVRRRPFSPRTTL